MFGVNDVIALFGNFEYYWVRSVSGMEVLRYTDSNYAEMSTVGFQAFASLDARYAGAIVNDKCEAVSAYVAAAT